MNTLLNGGLTGQGYNYLLGRLEKYSYEFKDFELDKMLSVLGEEKERRKIEESSTTEQ